MLLLAHDLPAQALQVQKLRVQKVRVNDWQALVQQAPWPWELRSTVRRPALPPQSAAELEQRQSR